MTGAERFTIDRSTGPLSDADVAAVLDLAAAADQTDGVYPLDESIVLRLRRDGDPAAVHLLARRDGQLAGYAHLDPGPEATAELIVRPAVRRQGLGRLLLARLVREATGADQLRVWAHGDHPGATVLAERLGFARARVLHRLRRPLTDDLPAPRFPAGVKLRSFVPGSDDDAWLRVNARAFASHPEQGRWTARDLQLRMAEPWFDPAGFLLAVRESDGALLGFHWTKVHRDLPTPIGEVYVLGVDPAAHGMGLGTALTLAGLRHLRERGLTQVMLYVDDTNQPAMRLYTGLGFEPWWDDAMFARPLGDAAPAVSG